MNRKGRIKNEIRNWLIVIGLVILSVELIALVIKPGLITSKESKKLTENTSKIQQMSVSPTLELKEASITQKLSPVEDDKTKAATTDNKAKTDVLEASETEKKNIQEETVQASKKATDKVQQMLNKMDLHEKICQMFIVFPDSLTGVSNVTAAGGTTKKSLAKYPVGGLLYMAGNLKNGQQVIKMIQGVQSFSEIPLFIASDEEGGRVARVMKTLQPYSMKAMMAYKDMGKEKAYMNAKIIAGAIEKYGFNTDFAPVADVWSNKANTVIGDRAYSDDFKQAAKLVGSAVQGFEEKGIICSLKHFPGHGNTIADSHYATAYVTKKLDNLRKEEFLPFKAGIKAGADMVMVGHLVVKDVDSEPATLSYKIITQILRKELKFNGVVITDALNMQAMTDHYGSSYIAVHAVKAGADILLCPANLGQSVDALEKAVKTGQISEKRIDESVKRILQLKVEKGII